MIPNVIDKKINHERHGSLPYYVHFVYYLQFNIRFTNSKVSTLLDQS
jgi:hypothetical protein